MVICSSGTWTAFITNSTINDHKFESFLLKLNKWLKNSNFFGYNQNLLMQNNCSIHKTKEVKIKLKTISTKAIYLLPYSPQFAPIELIFGLFKRNLS